MTVVDALLNLPILSARQPWASYLVSGLKSIELRTWRTVYRGWLWIHAGKQADLEAMQMLRLHGEDFSCGGLAGLVKLEEIRLIDSERQWRSLQRDHLSPGHFHGPCYGWQIADSLSLPDLIQCSGELGLFYLGGVTRARVRQHLESEPETFLDLASELIAAED
jgi:hypothetical protein